MNFLAYSSYVFNTNITWYSIFVLTGAIVAYLLCKYFYKKEEVSKQFPDLIDTLFLIVFPAGLLGARIWYVFSELDYYLADPIKILKVWEGGIAIQGGVMGGVLAGYLYLKIKKIPISFFKMADLIIPNILIAQSIGRWGNFFNQEVYGGCVSRDSLSFIPDFILNNMEGGKIYCRTGYVAQPLFLYESILTLLGFILISIVIRKFYTKRVNGELCAFYFIYYGIVRIIMEPFRNEEFIMRVFGNISLSILTSALFIIVGISLVIYLEITRFKKKKTNNEKEAIEND